MKKAIVFIVAMALIVPFSFASDKKAEWLRELKEKIQKITPSKDVPQTTVVGGVRGADSASPEALYWKGKEEKIVIGEGELNKFNAALDLALRGENKSSIREFETFIDTYPASPLKNEAEKTMEILKEK